MAKIQLLDKSIYARIAAGEVVESPASLLKELVENSLDANATEIDITIEGGGINFISVVDNGVGIAAEDMPLVFTPHATSKISSLDDLNAILTLGFRGEALASISSVADVTLTSRLHNLQEGNFLSCNHGANGIVEQIDCKPGTSLVIKNLFEKIPARKKFLKKESLETKAITQLVKNLILANPTVAFRYTADKKLIYNSSGKNLEDAIYAVYGDYIEALMPISHSMSGITLSGYASLPENAKHDKSFQTVIVNNRVVENIDISSAAFVAYKNYLLPRKFAAYILHITIPHDLVDVNVHPNKKIIKFVNPSLIASMVRAALKKVVELPTRQFWDNPIMPQVALENVDNLQDFSFENAENSSEKFANLNANYNKAPNYTVYNLQNAPESRKDLVAEPDYVVPKPSRSQTMDLLFSALQDNSNDNSCDIFAPVYNDFSSVISTFDYSIVGTFFNTYITIQYGNELYFIDQHAAHERILFDKLTNNVNSKCLQIQPLLLPYEFSLELEKAELLESKLSSLYQLGFNFTNIATHNTHKTYAISAVPSVLSNIKLQEFIYQITQNDSDVITNANLISEQIAKKACKLAIKAGDSLSQNEIHHLVMQLKNQQSPPLCPHGRPTIIRFSRQDIEKWFMRRF